MDGRDFERIYDEHAAALVRFLLYRTGDVSVAEDLAADTFERVLLARRPYDPRKGSRRTWIYAIALNVLRDHSRRRSAEGRALVQTAPADDSYAPDDERIVLRDEVSRALTCLTPQERESVALRYGADLRVADIARLLGEKPSATEKRLYRALGKLRTAMLSVDELR